MADLKELTLISKAMKGNQRAFEDLVKLKSQTILFHAYGVMGNYHDAEDATQEVILKIHDNITKLKKPKSFNAWLHRIITNVCYSMGRKMQSQHEQLGYDPMADDAINIKEEEKDFLPMEYLESQEEKSRVKQIIDSLPEKRRRTIYLYFFDEMSYKEIAYAMNITVSTVSTNIIDAKKMIKEEMENKNNQKNASMASLPVLTQIMNEKATETISPEYAEKIADTSLSAAGHLIKPWIVKLQAALKYSLIVTISTGLITTGIVTVLHKPEEKVNEPASAAVTQSGISPSELQAEILFKNGECDCGHLNPKKIVIKAKTEDNLNKHWEILDKKSKIVYKGDGNKITTQLSKLVKDKRDGTYTVKFILGDNDDVIVERDFVIDTDIQEGDTYL